MTLLIIRLNFYSLEPNVSDDFQEWLDNTRRQAASRPRYGLLG